MILGRRQGYAKLVSIIRHLGWQTASSGAVIILGFVYSIVFARFLDPRDYGLFALGLSVATLALRFFEATVYEGFVYFFARSVELGEFAKAVALVKLGAWAEVIVGFIGALALLGLNLLAPHLFVNDNTFFLVLSLSVFACFLGKVPSYTLFGVFRVLDDFRGSAIVRVARQAIAVTVVALALGVFNASLVEVLLIECIVRFIGAIALVVSAQRLMRRRFPLACLSAPISACSDVYVGMWRYAKNSYFSALWLIPSKEMDIAIVGYFGSLETVGMYQLAKRFMLALEAISDIIVAVIYPEITKRWSRAEFASLNHFIRRASTLLGLTAIGVVLACLAGFGLVIDVLVGAQYSGSVAVFHLMVWALLVRLPLEWLSPLLLAAEKPHLVQIASLIAGLATLGLFALFIPAYGAGGAAVAYALSSVVLFAALLCMAWRSGILHKLSAAKA